MVTGGPILRLASGDLCWQNGSPAGRGVIYADSVNGFLPAA